MNVLHVLICFHTSLPKIQGGINAMIATLSHEWIAMGHRVSIFAPGEWSQRRWSVERFDGLAIYKKRMRMPWEGEKKIRGALGFILEAPLLLFQLWQLCRREKIDLIHLHTPRDYQNYFYWLRRLGGPPYVLTFHGTDALAFANRCQAGFSQLRRIARGAVALTSVSGHYAALIEKNHPDLAPVYLLANGIGPLDTTPGLHGRVETSYPGRLPPHYFIVVGWVEPPKAQDVVVRAWGLLKKRCPDLHLLIIGRAPILGSGEPFFPGYWDSLRSLMVGLGCEDRVHLLGALEPETLLYVSRRAQGLVFPSKREGMPYALLEAGALALPVVCNDIPPFSALITHGKNGLLVAGDDPQAWADAITALHTQKSWACTLGQNLFTTIREQYSSRVMAGGYLDLFSRWVGKGAGDSMGGEK